MVEQLKVKDREIVTPGDVLAEGMGFLPSKGTYRMDSKIMAERVGMISIEGKVIKLIPLSGAYSPRIGDKVIGKVIDILMTGWRMKIKSAYSAVLSMKDATSDFIPRGSDLTKYFEINDYVMTKITNVTSQKLVDVTLKGPGLRKLRGGRIIEVNSHKVPRVIGKEGSMVSMIKEATGCQILVGQNGRVWINGEPEQEVLAVQAIEKVVSEAHLPGLTDKMKAFLEKASGKKLTLKGSTEQAGPVFTKTQKGGSQ